MFSQESIRMLVLFLPILILSLSIHEWAHAKAADKLGDATAKYLGRLTIDPMAHISLMGTVVFPAIAVLTGAPLFGWAKPVPVDMRNFKNPRGGMGLVAAAGPASNILIALLLAATLSFANSYYGAGVSGMRSMQGLPAAIADMLIMGVQLNAFLAFFNLLPLPPLDGSRIVAGLGGKDVTNLMDRIEPYGFYILLGIFFFFRGLLQYLVIPVMIFINLVLSLFGVQA